MSTLRILLITVSAKLTRRAESRRLRAMVIPDTRVTVWRLQSVLMILPELPLIVAAISILQIVRTIEFEKFPAAPSVRSRERGSGDLAEMAVRLFQRSSSTQRTWPSI